MMNHNDIRHKLSEYIDNAVSDGEKAEIEAHLATCRICSDALEELRKTIEQVKEIEEIESPAWMTGKIMAQVRAEAEQKKSFFRRFFYPLAFKIPIQTVAVLFLAVTVYYIYQNINPAAKYAEAPMEIKAEKAAPEPAKIAKEDELIQAPAPRMKKTVQEPGYKSLDMKYEYEKPTPPVPMKEAAAPAPAPAAPAPAPAAVGATSGAPESKMMRSIAPEAMQDKPEQPADFTASIKAKSATPAGKQKQSARSHDAEKAELSGIVMPRFEDYPALPVRIDRPSAINFDSHPKARQFRAAITAGAKDGPNFAGHYTIAQWGCGTSCVSFAIIEAQTGIVYFPAILTHVSWAGWWDKEYGLKFRLDSNLLKVYGSPNEQDRKGIFYYIWNNNELKLFKADSKE